MRKLKNTKTFFKKREGAAAVEFALIANVLFLMVFGIIEFGIVLYDQGMIGYKTRELARIGALYHYDAVNEDRLSYVLGTTATSDLDTWLTGALVTFGTDSNPVDVTTTYYDSSGGIITDPNSLSTGDSVVVTTTFKFEFLVLKLLAPGLLSDPITLKSEARMVVE